MSKGAYDLIVIVKIYLSESICIQSSDILLRWFIDSE